MQVIVRLYAPALDPAQPCKTLIKGAYRHPSEPMVPAAYVPTECRAPLSILAHIQRRRDDLGRDNVAGVGVVVCAVQDLLAERGEGRGHENTHSINRTPT